MHGCHHGPIGFANILEDGMTSQVGEKRGNHAACKKCGTKILFQLFNQRSVDSKYNIYDYKKQNASIVEISVMAEIMWFMGC